MTEPSPTSPFHMSPFVKWGLVALAAIGSFQLYDRASAHVRDLEAQAEALESRRAALLSVAELPDLSETQEQLDEVGATLEERFLRGDTPGINSADLQARLSRIMSSCEISNPKIDVTAITPTEEDGEISPIGELVATISGRDTERRIADCLALLEGDRIHYELVGLKWLSSSLVQLEIKALTLAPEEEAG